MHTHSAAGSPEPARPSLPDPARQASPGLPGGVWRDAFLEIVLEAFAGHISPTDEKVLRAYVRCTRPTDWSEPGRGPVAFAKQIGIADRLQVCPRTVLRAELVLERLRLIEREALANGHRKGPRGGGDIDGLAAIGIGFAPMIARYDEIAEMAREAAIRRHQLDALRRRASRDRNRIRKLLRGLPGGDGRLREFERRYEGLPARIARMTELPELQTVSQAYASLYAEVLALRDALDEEAASKPAGETVIGGVRTTSETAAEGRDTALAVENTGDMSGKGDADVLPYIYTTTDPASVIFTTAPGKSAPADAGDAVEREQGAAGGGVNPEHPRQPQNHAPPRDPIAADWSAAQLYDAASDDFRHRLDRERRPGSALRPADFVEAAWSALPGLGVNQHAWGEACQVLGPFAAALAVLVLDRNRDHPTHPVRSPGGALRGMTAKAREGQLDLDASLFALLRRGRSMALDRLN